MSSLSHSQPDELVGITEAARTLDVSKQRVRQLTAEGKLSALRMQPTGFRVFFRADVERLKAEREAKAGAN